jgi:integrase
MIGVPTLHPHDFRHSGAQLRKLKGMKIEDISVALNHGGIDVTRKHYLRQDKAEMRNKMDQFKL